MSVHKLYSKYPPLAWTHAQSHPRSILVKIRLFKTALDIDELPFQFIHTVDLSVVNTMLHESPDLVIYRTEIWAVWRPQVGRKKVWRFLTLSSTVARALRGVPVHCTPCTCNSKTAASRNAKLSCAQPVASKQPRSQSCGLRHLCCHAASCLPQKNP